MALFDRLRIVLIGFALSLGVACIFLPWAINSMQDMIERTLVHDVAWSGANGRDDFNNLVRNALLMNARLTDDSVVATTLALDIFTSRVETWKSGSFGAFVAADRRRQRWLTQINSSNVLVREALQTRSPENWPSSIIEQLQKVDGDVQNLTRAAYVQSIQDRDENKSSLQYVQMIQQVLIIALLATAFLFVGLLSWQNVALKRSNAAEKRIAADNAFLAAHDVLTGLANRTALGDYLSGLSSGHAGQSLRAVLLLDLDGFKSINDVLGHAAGDLLLISVSKRLQTFADLIPNALVARLGGDEFLLIVPSVSDVAAALRIGEAALATVRESCNLGAHTVSVDVTVGIAVAEADHTSAPDLIDQADIALGTAKSSGKGRVVLFEPSMLDQIAARRKIEANLTSADVWKEFEPYFQPIVELASSRVIGFEALARWKLPDGTFVSPAEFIPVAETSGKIIEIGRVMLFKACQAAVAYPDPVVVSVNLSAVQLIKLDVPALVLEVLAATGLPPERLKLEITESVFINDMRNVKQLIDTLKKMGVTLSLDDFGTGYSSLSYLRTLGFDELKIDRSFVSEIGTNKRSLAVTHTIIQLARTLDMKTVAEGIETEEQARLLTAMGCSCGQGYHFGRPAPMHEWHARHKQNGQILKVA
jgi:diguanylate cyclase (GGDEF)-like protein